ncbi:MAG: hypothetical protein L0H79_14455 [Intrasporangium sp.]|uniref:hypothetical protein n=1 Tax=Intrasporangium sp. TaxID=1925024 RepID=UPI002649CCAB|nr:hypothetical protein [Intrasporangium sp.]MDN5796943.1 hypothetical protein [Intrasporangium sp.]
MHHGALAYLLGINALRTSEAAAVRIKDYADPRTTEHYNRARGNLDRHGVHFLTAHVAGV